jgi:hypothetical protein
MAFLFKSKKNSDKAQGTKDASSTVAGSQSSFQSSNGRVNEKGAVQQSSTPSSSVNNSMNSLQGGGTATPSPEQVNGRRGLSTDQAQDLPVSTCHHSSFCTICCRIPLNKFTKPLIPSYGTALRPQSNR